jgi:hypothetical protein
MSNPLQDLGKLVPKETIVKLYDDVVSGPAKEVGKIGTDTLKVVRLILAPLQIGAALQDRFARMVERISSRVPEDRQTAISPELAGPVLEKMTYVIEESELWKMYEEILTKGIDKDQIHSVHPSFGHIISQLSRDEAWIIYLLRDRNFQFIDTMDYDRELIRFFNRKIEQSTIPTAELRMPNQINLYYLHLQALGLVAWPVDRQESINSGGVQTGIRRYSTLQLTEFGRLFVQASIPLEGFESGGTG